MYKESVVRGSVQSEHFVQLFDSRESLAESVAAYLKAAYEHDHNLLVAAKPANWGAIEMSLDASGCDVAAWLKSERLVVLDAVSVARTLTRNDMPDADRFEQTVGKLVRRLSKNAPLSIYGEVVELYAEEANFAAALKLEDIWDALAETISFRLMCGYSSAHFAAPGAETKLHRVCRAHSHVLTTADDPLGAWLVERARLPFRPQFLPAS